MTHAHEEGTQTAQPGLSQEKKDERFSTPRQRERLHETQNDEFCLVNKKLVEGQHAFFQQKLCADDANAHADGIHREIDESEEKETSSVRA